MVIKEIILLLAVLSIIVSGCLSSEENNEQDEDSGDNSGGSGGSQDTWTTQEMETTEGETETAEEIWTPEETSDNAVSSEPEESGTPSGENPVEQQEASDETSSGTPTESEWAQTEPEVNESGNAAVESDETGSSPYLVRLKDYLLIPSTLEINTGDIVVWRNYEESTVFVLTSKEGLFENQKIAYGRTFEYTFSEPGTYSFSVEGFPQMQMTITVK